MRTALCLLMAGLAVLPVRAALAWGEVAHQVICEIAWQELSDPARQRVQALLDQDPQYATFSSACLWPDQPRLRASEHYVNLPRQAPAAQALTSDPCPLAETCVVTAIASELAILRSGASDAQKLEALKFLGHWVGDVHQPLHVGFADDQGGNAIQTSGRCRGSLHRVWDSCLVEHQLGTDIAAIARSLRVDLGEAERTAWRHGGPVAWANESFRIATAADLGYCVPQPQACWYAVDNEQLDPGEEEKTLAVDDAYLDRQRPRIQEQLKKAGVRLAGLLNESLGAGRAGPPPPPAAAED